MPGKAAKVVITERQQTVLLEWSKSRSVSRAVVQRATIILLAFAGRANEEIAATVGLGRVQVGLWRRRWRDAWNALTAWECKDPRRLREALREVFREAPRAGAPATFAAPQVTEIVTVACEPPEKSGRPITHWTHRELRDEVVKRQIVPKVSVAQVGRYLKQAVLQPQRRQMWINTTETDRLQLKKDLAAVCQTYLAAIQRQLADGTRTVCFDEMTGLQALERNSPDKLPRPGEMAKYEFEYTRHGTTTLIGNLDVVSGQMICPTLGPTRTEPDLLAHLQRTVATDPEVSWVLVGDRLNVHWSESLVRWVAGLCEPERDLGKKGRRGVLKSQASRRAFLSDPSHRIRFVYLPKHCSWLNQIEVVFGITSRKVVRRGNFTSVADLEEKVKRFLEYFNQTMAHPFNWTYTGKPLAKARPGKFCPPHRRRLPQENVKLAKNPASCSGNCEAEH